MLTFLLCYNNIFHTHTGAHTHAYRCPTKILIFFNSNSALSFALLLSRSLSLSLSLLGKFPPCVSPQIKLATLSKWHYTDLRHFCCLSVCLFVYTSLPLFICLCTRFMCVCWPAWGNSSLLTNIIPIPILVVFIAAHQIVAAQRRMKKKRKA